MKTACGSCQYYFAKKYVRYAEGPQIWYNDFCKASPLPLSFNYVTGEETEPKPRYAYCRDINTGNCVLYKEKES